ncbi:hypothetical protein AMK26_17490 [Streptomyces sp. CB03234]|uniref:EamA family transporter n=1 Tax=Streptomyces sp. (strain CB03234) TaxID=1703937 RepID=UPI00093CE50C|nr:EamA family transporter [Streptomyces sp. CB03234]OKK03326.1 hypothetical protein AMK26_17490 [Streptomyces sp. CB03234]
MVDTHNASGLALLAAATFGTADYLGGLSTRRTGLASTALAAQLAGCVALLVATAAHTGNPTLRDLLWGAAAGVADCAGLLLLFKALSIGAMAGVAPVSGVVSSALPVVAGVFFGERVAGVQWAGIVVGVIAVAAVSLPGRSSGEAAPGGAGGAELWRPLPMVLGAVAGSGFALYYILFSRISDDSGVAPVLSARIASAVVVVVWVGWLVKRRAEPLAPPRRLGTAVASGVLASAGNLVLVLALREGQLGLVAVLASLYPAVTVLLALAILRERPGPWQLVGIGAAVAAVGMISAA